MPCMQQACPELGQEAETKKLRSGLIVHGCESGCLKQLCIQGDALSDLCRCTYRPDD